MTDTEIYLSEVLEAEREIRRKEVDLRNAQLEYNAAYENQSRSINFDVVVQKHHSKRSPTEEAAIIIIDIYRARVDDIEKDLNICRAIIADVQQTVLKAALCGREREYIELMYYKGYSAKKTAQLLFCSERTLTRIREKALNKIEAVRKKSP